MMTVKLLKSHGVRIVEAESVEVYPAGPIDRRNDNDPLVGSSMNDVREVQVLRGDKCEVFYVADRMKAQETEFDQRSKFASVELYDRAYIENQSGKTIEVVKPY